MLLLVYQIWVYGIKQFSKMAKKYKLFLEDGKRSMGCWRMHKTDRYF